MASLEVNDKITSTQEVKSLVSDVPGQLRRVTVKIAMEFENSKLPYIASYDNLSADFIPKLLKLMAEETPTKIKVAKRAVDTVAPRVDKTINFPNERNDSNEIISPENSAPLDDDVNKTVQDQFVSPDSSVKSSDDNESEEKTEDAARNSQPRWTGTLRLIPAPRKDPPPPPQKDSETIFYPPKITEKVNVSDIFDRSSDDDSDDTEYSDDRDVNDIFDRSSDDDSDDTKYSGDREYTDDEPGCSRLAQNKGS